MPVSLLGMYIYTTKKSCSSIPCPASMLMLCFRGKIRRKASRRRVRIRKRMGGRKKREGKSPFFLVTSVLLNASSAFRDAYGPSFKCLVWKLNPRDFWSRGFNLTGLFVSVACWLCCTNWCHIVFL